MKLILYLRAKNSWIYQLDILGFRLSRNKTLIRIPYREKTTKISYKKLLKTHTIPGVARKIQQ